MLTPKGIKKREALPPNLRQTQGNKHTTLATPGYIWITNTGTQMLERINTTTLEVATFASGGGTPVGIAFDGTYLYVSHFSSGNVTKMTTAGEVLASYPISYGLHQIVFDGVDLWVTSYYEGKIYKLSTSGTPILSYDSGRYPVDLTVADNKIWVGLFDFTFHPFGTGGLLKLNNNGTLNAEYPIGENPLGIDFGDNHIWTANFLTGDVFKVNASNGTVVLTFNTGIPDSAILHLSYSTYGNYILITISKDYSSYNLPNSENVVQIRSATTGVFVETVPVGIDPRNVSIDEFHWGYVAGYGDGSVTRFLLPTSVQTYDILLHFNSYPFTSDGTHSTTQTAPSNRLTTVPEEIIYGTGSLISNQNNSDNWLEIFSDDVITIAESWTIRMKFKIRNSTLYLELLEAWTDSYISIAVKNDTNVIQTMMFSPFATAPITVDTVQELSVELLEGVVYTYIDGLLVGNLPYLNPYTNAPINSVTLAADSKLFTLGRIGNSVTAGEETICDEFIFVNGTALAGGASSYTTQTSPYLP
jgi:hypothetical protein